MVFAHVRRCVAVIGLGDVSGLIEGDGVVAVEPALGFHLDNAVGCDADVGTRRQLSAFANDVYLHRVAAIGVQAAYRQGAFPQTFQFRLSHKRGAADQHQGKE